MSVLETLEPGEVFRYFEEICGIPHGSGNTKQISDYLVNFAIEHNLAYRQESCNNVIIWKEASKGCENAPTVMLQGHMDMVTVKEEDCPIDMETQGLDLAISEDGNWIYAKGTSLGGDDGIAIAYALAILADDTLEHPPLEVVITVDEEIGLLGADALDASDLHSSFLLNMDSEEDGIFLIGCAGGATADCRLPVSTCKASGMVYQWSLKGLMGGHSGTEIQKERLNANLVLGRYLSYVGKEVALQAGAFQGGEKDNAIANQCECILVVNPEDEQAFLAKTALFIDLIKKENAITEPSIELVLSKQDRTEAEVLGGKDLEKLITLLALLPNGVQKHIADMPEMVQTSLNMGILSLKDQEVSMTFSVRSSVASEKEWLLNQLEILSTSMGGYCKVSGVYPGWEYNPNSTLRPLMMEIYQELTQKEAIVEAIHAGVECGILCEKLPGLDCISYGPDIEEIHTVRERLHIPSTKLNFELTKETLRRIAKM